MQLRLGAGGDKRQWNSVCVALRIAGEGFWERNGATAFRVLMGRQCEAGERELEASPVYGKRPCPVHSSSLALGTRADPFPTERMNEPNLRGNAGDRRGHIRLTRVDPL